VSLTPRPVVAAFDLDGTLTKGGSVFPWLMALAGTPRTYLAALRLIVPLTIGAIRSSRWADSAKEQLFFALLAGREESVVEDFSRHFALHHLSAEGRPETLARLHWHLAHGHHVVLVSASPEIYVRVVAEQLGAGGACGTRLACDPRGRLTGHYLGRNCRGTEKMRRLDEWIASRGFDQQPVIYAYGNSRGDRRMLKMADHPVNVGKLGRWGRLREFPGLTPLNESLD
jgi:HAD superfamily hydrolase (TIGR01490 family)